MKRTSSKKSLPKSLNSSSSKVKKTSGARASHNKDSTSNNHNPLQNDMIKKTQPKKLTKKKIEDLKTPDLLLKVHYRNKKLSIPISHLDEKSFQAIISPHIMKFETEVLKNISFSYSEIMNWKTTGSSTDILKDFYIQTDRSLQPFKGQVLEIEPIWKKPNPAKISLVDFEILKCIGTGGFSRVFLVRFKNTGQFYAMKLVEKHGLMETGKECVVANERDIMVQLNSPFIVNLDAAFETKQFVALCLEYCPGGELFNYMRKVRKMSEEDSRYCFIEILLGIQYLHNQKIIYRDIKPENIMIAEDGHLRIADFGLSRQGITGNELAYTYCGSPEYMAPQMLDKSGHGFAVDYYCLGALLYEMVTGNPPFYSRDVEKIYHSIQNEEITFPSHVSLSPDLEMLLEGLLRKDPKKRLGSLGGIKEILGHPWVRKLKVADVVNRTIPSPIKVELLNFNINEDEIQEGQAEFLVNFEKERPEFQPLFEDFYFKRNEDINIVEEVFHSVKSDSTKENKSQPAKNKVDLKNKVTGYKSAMSRELGDKYQIDIKNPTSEMLREKPFKKLKRNQTNKNLNMIERSKKNGNKSFTKKKQRIERVLSPCNAKRPHSGLKRAKSSNLLVCSNKHKL